MQALLILMQKFFFTINWQHSTNKRVNVCAMKYEIVA